MRTNENPYKMFLTCAAISLRVVVVIYQSACVCVNVHVCVCVWPWRVFTALLWLSAS